MLNWESATRVLRGGKRKICLWLWQAEKGGRHLARTYISLRPPLAFPPDPGFPLESPWGQTSHLG